MTWLILWPAASVALALIIGRVIRNADNATLINNTRNGSPNMDRKRLGVTHHAHGDTNA